MEDLAKLGIGNMTEFIVSSNDENKFTLITKDEFYKKFELQDDNAIDIDIQIGEIKTLLANGLVTEVYFEEEWQGIENFKNFINDKSALVKRRIDFDWEIEIIEYVASNKTISEKIDYLIDEKSELMYLQLHEDFGLGKRIDFLNIKIEELELKSKYKLDEYVNTVESEVFNNYSDNLLTERIVFLHELGILDYLRDKMVNELHVFSANKLAEIISTFTGIDKTTAQSYLNPIYTKDVKQKNNPLSTDKMEIVRNKLQNIGFKTSKSN